MTPRSNQKLNLTCFTAYACLVTFGMQGDENETPTIVFDKITQITLEPCQTGQVAAMKVFSSICLETEPPSVPFVSIEFGEESISEYS